MSVVERASCFFEESSERRRWAGRNCAFVPFDASALASATTEIGRQRHRG